MLLEIYLYFFSAYEIFTGTVASTCQFEILWNFFIGWFLYTIGNYALKKNIGNFFTM